MVIKEGYKQTEIGVIPNDWEVKNIGDVCQIFGRIGFRGYTVNDIVKKEQGAITISPSNIYGDKINFAKCTYISWFKYHESPEIKIYNGDVLLVKTGSTSGKTALVKNLNEKAHLQDLVEEEMRSKGLDPLNKDDVQKYWSSKGIHFNG